MLDFEKAHPDIAKKYFDLRFDEENQYGKCVCVVKQMQNSESEDLTDVE